MRDLRYDVPTPGKPQKRPNTKVLLIEIEHSYHSLIIFSMLTQSDSITEMFAVTLSRHKLTLLVLVICWHPCRFAWGLGSVFLGPMAWDQVLRIAF
jgi:hypothetical protein